MDKLKNTLVDKATKRKELGIPEEAFLLVSAGELNKNKNHQVVIKALAELNNPRIHYMIAGIGPLKDYLIDLASRLGVSEQIHLLGYRNDVAELYKASDVCVFPSIREGLGLAAIEGMAAGLPLVCSDNRGTREFAEDGVNGYVCMSGNAADFCRAINSLYNDNRRIKLYGCNGLKKSEEYDTRNIIQMMGIVYERL